MNLNVGQVIEHVVRKDHMGITELSRKLHVSRRTIYNWFDQESLNFDIICKIGNVMNHDFSEEFPDDFARLRDEARAKKNALMDTEDNSTPNYSGAVNYWMNKYIQLLEKYNELLSQRYPNTYLDKEMMSEE
ncbi:helix-turn-helix domain-containing protein [Pedobacter gandavensis]|uniref:helix-turn-helix domain-containing protein n=1 Tax=Pedobacter gandavensis TaxID=2679963 RepID=UPI00292E29B7|nr:helix-turn-helix domain-containing protein [Pedobacter gandavensis]